MINVEILAKKIKGNKGVVQESVLNIIPIIGHVRATEFCSEESAYKLDIEMKKLNDVDGDCYSFSDGTLRERAKQIVEDANTILVNLEYIWPVKY